MTVARQPTGSIFGALAELLDPTPDPYYNDPVLWRKTYVPAFAASVYQDEILTALATYHRACARGPHGLGKSAMAANAVLWFADTRERAGVDWKVVCTAGAWRQLSHYLWPEIHKWSHKLRHRTFTRNELLTLELKLRYGQAFAVASDDPANIEGAHADEILYVIDEGKNVVAGTWDAIEGAMSTGEAYALAISTPGRAEGRFFDIQKRKPGTEDWWVKHVTLEDAIAAGRIKRSWAEQRKRQWGEYSPVYQNRVLGEFSTKDQEGIIPLEWVEAAIDRWQTLAESSKLNVDPITNVSCDVASTGPDSTITAVRRGNVISKMIENGSGSTMSTTGRIASLLNIDQKRKPYAVVDVIGVGTGVVDRLREQEFMVDAFAGSSAAVKSDRSGELTFLNRRAEAWWLMRDALDPTFDSEIALPPEDLLLGDLTSPKWDQTSTGRIKVEEKDEIRKRLGRSPDYGDAVVMAFNGRAPDSEFSGVAPITFEKSSTWRS